MTKKISLLFLLAMLLAGCGHAVRHTVTPEYYRARPRTVAVLPVVWEEGATEARSAGIDRVFNGMVAEKVRSLGYTVIAVAILFASCLQASIGFGMGMLAAPVVAIVDPSLIPGTLIMLAAVVTLAVTVRERESIDFSGTGWALVGRVPGTIAGGLLLAAIPERVLVLLIACVVLLGVALTSFGWMPVPRPRNLVLAGATSGVLGTATSIGGPPMALVWQRNSGARLRGTMSGFFLVGSILSIGVLAATGAVTAETFRMCALLLPAIVGGYILSRYVNGWLNPVRQRWTAIAMSIAGAVVLVAKELGVL